MAKKRKVSRRTEPTGPREVDDKDARLTIRTYEDVADSQDEYWANKDRIDFDSDEEPRVKRARKEEDFLEASDEEILGQDESDESEDEEEVAPVKKGKKAIVQDSDDEDRKGEDDEGDEGDEGWWGANRDEYYDADQIETEGDALEEEAEAKRLRAKRSKTAKKAELTKDEWAPPQDEAGDDREVVTEVLKEIEVTEDMGPEERYTLLKSRYPEFDFLVDRFNLLLPLLATLQKEAQGKPAKSLEVVKSWVLGCYIAALASYFAVMTSPSRDGDGSESTLKPSELRDHEVMETLAECEEAWEKVSQFKPAKTASQLGMLSPPDEGDVEMDLDFEAPTKKTKAKLSKAEIKAKKEREAEKAKKAQAMEEALGDLSTMLKGTKKASKEARAVAADAGLEDDHSDFGEEDVLDDRAAADKAKRKKSLKFYTSQIVQKSNKRAGAGRDAGGDMDIPYRERLRDRQARLNAEAERRGQKDSKFGKGAELGGDDSDGDDAMAKGVRDGEDEYYDMVAQKAQQKKEGKAARHEALAQAKKDERVVEQTTIGDDGKRQISYQIQKNKGLTPHRRKEVRNPRVKKRMMFEAKKKKLRSIKAVYKGGEGKGGYQGEMSGIKTGIVKSTKL